MDVRSRCTFHDRRHSRLDPFPIHHRSIRADRSAVDRSIIHVEGNTPGAHREPSKATGNQHYNGTTEAKGRTSHPRKERQLMYESNIIIRLFLCFLSSKWWCSLMFPWPLLPEWFSPRFHRPCGSWTRYRVRRRFRSTDPLSRRTGGSTALDWCYLQICELVIVNVDA